MNQHLPTSGISIPSDDDGLPQSYSGGAVASPRESDGESPQPGTRSTRTVEALKTGGSKLATFLKNKTALAADALAQQKAKFLQRPPVDPSSVTLRERAAETLGKVTVKAQEGGAWLYQASVKTAAKTADEIRKMTRFGSTLQWQCKVEARTTPCPRVLLMCCTAIAAGGLQTEGILTVQPAADEIERLAQIMGRGVVPFPPNTSFHQIASLLKYHLASLPEPLLTYKLADDWLQAEDDLQLVHALLSQLPLANHNVLCMVLGLCHAICQHSMFNHMDAAQLASTLAPCLLWKAAPKAPPAMSMGVHSPPSIMVPSMAPHVPGVPAHPPPPYNVAQSDGRTSAVDNTDMHDILPPMHIPRAHSVESQLSASDSEMAVMAAVRGMSKQPLDAHELDCLAQTIACTILNYASLFNA